jgi:putative aldouronate transport system permease protein
METGMISSSRSKTGRPKKSLVREIKANKHIYLLILPAVLFYLIFHYVPMYGVTLAFKKFNFVKGITGSKWVGLTNFKYIISEPEFWNAFKNTIIISFGKLIWGFPMPIILAILFSELRMNRYKKVAQTVFTFPNFLSWVIVAGFVRAIFADESGVYNALMTMLHLPQKSFLGNPKHFRSLLYLTGIWKGAGWGSIIYLATISSVDPTLYEAAAIDGAGRIRNIIHIKWPAIKSTVVLLLLLNIGGVMSAGFDQIFNLYNPTVYSTGDIIDTYVYRLSFERAPRFEVSVAVDTFKSVINFMLLFSADRFAKLIGERGIF